MQICAVQLIGWVLLIFLQGVDGNLIGNKIRVIRQASILPGPKDGFWICFEIIQKTVLRTEYDHEFIHPSMDR